MSSRSAGRRGKDALLAALALPWDAAFAVRGWLSRAQPEPWSSPGGLRVLVVAPHPDDEVAGCGGTILLHRARGDAVVVVHVTDGRASRALGLGPDEMARRRRAEAVRAAEILDVRAVWLGLPEGAWSTDELAERLGALLAELDPDVIYAPSCVDFHPEHRGVAAALARALRVRVPSPRREAGVGAREPVVRAFESQVPLTATLAVRIAAIGPVEARAHLALEAYGTQLGSLRRTLRMKRYVGLRHRVGGPAEVFWEMTQGCYASLHATASAGPTPFRGVRQLPLRDPLAYLSGSAERRRLAELAAGPGRGGV
jgi:LmbE family N-acetylglucosaminyl deacetylase